MKFKMFHDPNKKTLSIPRAALQMSKLADAEELTIHTESGCVLLARDDLTAAECVAVMKLLTDNTVALMEQLAKATQEAAEENDCDHCGADGCSGLSIPTCLLREANIDVDGPLTSTVEDGRIVITAAEEDGDDPLDRLDQAFLAVMCAAGVDLGGLRFLLEEEQGDE